VVYSGGGWACATLSGSVSGVAWPQGTALLMTFAIAGSSANVQPPWSHLAGGDVFLLTSTTQIGSDRFPTITTIQPRVEELILSGSYTTSGGAHNPGLLMRSQFTFSLGAEVASVTLGDLVIPAIAYQSGGAQGGWLQYLPGQPAPVTITVTAPATSTTGQVVQQWWQDTLQGQQDFRTLQLVAGQQALNYQFHDCVPIRLRQQVVHGAIIEVLEMTCFLDSVGGNLRADFMGWLNDTLQGNNPLRDLSIDATDLTGVPVPSRDYLGVVITGYRFPSFDIRDTTTPAADAMRFQPSQRLYP
jgi:hypothetical protein